MLLEIKNLAKSFGDKNLFSNLSFKFPENGIIAVTGESGVGKTTLLRIICGLDNDYFGEIIRGRELSFSFCFQEHRLFSSVNALDNLALVCFEKKNENTIEISKEMLRALGFAENDMKLFPRELSGGMKQRVSLARAFLKEADVLLLDEPTKELDNENVSLVLEQIKKQGEKRLVIIVTHNQRDIEALGAEIIRI